MKLEKNRYSFVLLGSAIALIGCSSHSAPPTVSTQAPVVKPQATAPKPNTPAVSQGLVKPFYESEGNTLSAAEEIDEEDVTSGPVIGAEVEKEITQSHIALKDKGAVFDIPMILNQQVEKWIDYFQNRGRGVYANWLKRSGKYVPMMQRILRENGLPQDLVYLSMIESGFKPYAYSHAAASGPWQFINGTGSRYGLRNTAWIDERRDPEKSTLAAAQHLKDLYDQFNHWYLAAASYNAGAGKIGRAIDRYSTEDFWEMSQYSYLKPETKNYVPKMLAAALLAKNPEKFGFGDVVFDEPETYTRVTVTGATSLSHVADALGVPLEQLKQLNPELKRGTTPPHWDSYELKVPEGMDQKFIAAYPDIQKRAHEVQVATHVVRKGESLSSIAQAYGVSSSSLARSNGLRSRKVHRGQTLTVQYKANGLKSFEPSESEELSVASVAPSRKKQIARASAKEEVTERTTSTALASYKIKRGDTLWSISRKFNCSVNEIKQWNRFKDASDAKYGKTIRVMKRGAISVASELPDNKNIASFKQFEFRKGKKSDDFASFSKKHRMNAREIVKMNRLESKSLSKGRPEKTLRNKHVRL